MTVRSHAAAKERLPLLSVASAFGLDSSPGGDAAEYTALPSPLLPRILYSPLPSPPARCCINHSAASFSSVPALKMATASELGEPYATQDASIQRRQSSEILSTLSWELLNFFFYRFTEVLRRD